MNFKFSDKIKRVFSFILSCLMILTNFVSVIPVYATEPETSIETETESINDEVAGLINNLASNYLEETEAITENELETETEITTENTETENEEETDEIVDLEPQIFYNPEDDIELYSMKKSDYDLYITDALKVDKVGDYNQWYDFDQDGYKDETDRLTNYIYCSLKSSTISTIKDFLAENGCEMNSKLTSSYELTCQEEGKPGWREESNMTASRVGIKLTYKNGKVSEVTMDLEADAKLSLPRQTMGIYGIEVKVTFNEEPTTATIQKVSSNPEINADCSNAEFTIKNSEHTYKLTTDKSGLTEKIEVEPGTYTITETKAPEGFLIAPSQTVKIEKGEDYVIKFTDQPVMPVKITKASTDTSITNGNAMYSFAGIKFTLSNSENSYTFTTTADGTTETKLVIPGTYTLSEDLGTSKGYKKASNQTVTVSATATTTQTFEVKDEPIVNEFNWLVTKVDSRNNRPLAGAEFTVKYYDNTTATGTPKATWVLRSDAKKGQIKLDREYKVSGSAFYTYNGKNIIPNGSITIQETKAPDGYVIDSALKGPYVLNGNGINGGTTITQKDDAIQGRVSIEKWDAETKTKKAQGAATLEGAEFTIYNASGKDVYVQGLTGQLGELDSNGGKDYKDGEAIVVIKTNSDGVASVTENVLPGGLDSNSNPLFTYKIKETKAPTGYTQKGENLEQTFYISTDKQNVSLNTETTAAMNVPIRGDIDLVKFEGLKSSDESGSGLRKPLAGIEFTIKSKATEEEIVIVTDKKGFATTKSDEYPDGRLLYGEYTVTENPIEGMEPVVFDVTIDAELDEPLHFIIENDEIEAAITLEKVDAETGKSIPIADTTFQILDSNKNVVSMRDTYKDNVIITEFKTNEKGSVTLPQKLAYGTYYIKELQAPYGYLKGEDIEFKVDKASKYTATTVQTYGDKPAMGKIKIKKTDENTGDVLAGAIFEIYADDDITTPDGTVRVTKDTLVDTIIIDNDGLGLSKELYLGKYRVIEKTAPEGFALTTTVSTCELVYVDQETPIVYVEVEIPNTPTELELNKIDIDNLALEGVEFNISRIIEYPAIVTSELAIDGGTFVTDKEGNIDVKYLKHGVYEMKEVKTLPGYVLDKTPRYFTVNTDGYIFESDNLGNAINDSKPDKKVTLTWINDYTKGDFSKLDIVFGTEIIGATLQIRDEEDNVLYEWVTDGQPHHITKIPVGNYILHEEITPFDQGYVTSEDIAFTIAETGLVQKFKMIDDITKTYFSKTDITTGVELIGATLQIHDLDGNLIVEWVTDGTPKYIERIPVGKYTLTELTAPYGYLKAETVPFEILDTGDIQLVEMKDDYVVGQLAITKTGEFLQGKDAEYTFTDKANNVFHSIFNFFTGRVESATFEIYAEEDIKHPDGISPDFFKKGDLVATITTDATGIARLDSCPEAIVGRVDEPNFADGYLPLGTYRIKEVTASDGFVLNKDEVVVSLTYENQTTPVVYANSDYENLRQKVDIKITKIDAETKKPIEGAVFAIRAAQDIYGYTVNEQGGTDKGELVLSEGMIVEHAISDVNGLVTIKSDLPLGKYDVIEVRAADGYIDNFETFSFDCSYDASLQEQPTLVFEQVVENIPTEIKVEKFAIDTKASQAGATLQIVEKETGNVAYEFVTDANEHTIKYLKTRTRYLLHEVSPTPGYVTAPDIEFVIMPNGTVITNKVNTNEFTIINDEPEFDKNLAMYADFVAVDKLTMVDDFSKVKISKQDITTSEELVGATLQIHDEDSNLVVEWVTDGTPKYIEKLPVGNYTLTEITAPDGYICAETVDFTVEDTGDIQLVEMFDDYTKVKISKQDITTAEELIGATLQIHDEDGNLVAEWVTDGTPKYIEKLPVGNYTLTEITAPDGYICAETVDFTVEPTEDIQLVEMFDDYTKVDFSKSDITTAEEIIGATLQIHDKDGNLVAEWVTDGTPHRIDRLPVGNYTLTELTAPDGYVTAETVDFTVEPTGDVQLVEMKDDYTKVEISKQDITSGKPVIGAVLIIKDKAGNVVAKWVTDDKPHRINMLPVGDYTLTELTAPEGYLVAETVNFTVKDTGDIQKVVMYDQPTPSGTPSIQTGDSSPVIPLVSLVGFAMVGVIILGYKRKRK